MENNLENFQNIRNSVRQPSEDEMRADIERRFAEADNQEKAVQTQRFIAKNKLIQFKTRLLRDIFNSLMEIGVDPSNIESISRFLQSLERRDPDLLILFESAINALDPNAKTGLDVPPETGEPRPGEYPGLMGQYNNLQETILRKNNEGFEGQVPELPNEELGGQTPGLPPPPESPA